MELSIVEGKPKIIITPDEREIINKAGQKYDKLDEKEKVNIDLVFKNTFESINTSLVTFETFQSLIDSLSLYLAPNEAIILINLILNTRYLNQYLDQLKEEKIITGISNSFILSLSAKYGTSLRGILRKTQQPYDWIRIESDILISNETVMLQSYLIRGDGQSFLFNVPLRDIATFSEHFINKTLEGCKKFDKENLLDIEEKTLLKLVGNVNELKAIYESVKKKTSLIVENEEITK